MSFFPGFARRRVRVSGAVRAFRYSLALLNGEPIDDRPGRNARDPNSAKDIVGRLGIDTRPREDLAIAGGVSFIRGKGFHPGTDATKPSVSWRDLNDNGTIDGGELTAIPAAASRSATATSNSSTR